MQHLSAIVELAPNGVFVSDLVRLHTHVCRHIDYFAPIDHQTHLGPHEAIKVSPLILNDRGI